MKLEDILGSVRPTNITLTLFTVVLLFVIVVPGAIAGDALRIAQDSPRSRVWVVVVVPGNICKTGSASVASACAETFAACARADLGCPSDRVFLLSDADSKGSKRRLLIDTICHISSHSEADDTIVIYSTGPLEGKESDLVVHLSDSGPLREEDSIQLNALEELLQSTSLNSLVLLDSGRENEVPEPPPRWFKVTPQRTAPGNPPEPQRRSVLATIFACKPRQKSNVLPNGKCTVFLHYLCRYLKETNSPSSPNSPTPSTPIRGGRSVVALIYYLASEVPKAARQQVGAEQDTWARTFGEKLLRWQL